MSAAVRTLAAAHCQMPEERLAAVAAVVVRMQPGQWALFTPEREADRQKKRLNTLAREALGMNRNWDAAKDEFYERVRNDADLLWAMFAPFRSQAAQLILTEAARELRDELRDDEVAATARPSVVRFASSGSTVQQQRAGMAARAAVVQRSLLETFKVNGKPIGDVTKQQAIRWAGKRERDARFVRLLTDNLPPDKPIRMFRSAEATAAIFAKASAMDDQD